MRDKITARDVEFAAACAFDYRANIIVPNVAWGLGLRYEADMVVLRASGWAEETEIKVSASDIVRDLSKRHSHDSKLFRRFWFAVPEALAQHPMIPERAGILSVFKNRYGRYEAKVLRVARVNPDARKLTDSERQKLLHLGCMRIWNLKQHIQKIERS